MQEFSSRISVFFCIACRRQSHSGVSPRTPAAASGAGLGGAQPPSNRFVLVGSFSRRSIGSLKRSVSKDLDASGQRVTKSELAAQGRTQDHGQLVEFESEAFVGFQRGGRVTREQVPDLDQEFAGHCGDGDIAVAFSSEEFPAPLAQERGAAHAQTSLSALDEEMADVPTASFATPRLMFLPVPLWRWPGLSPM